MKQREYTRRLSFFKQVPIIISTAFLITLVIVISGCSQSTPQSRVLEIGMLLGSGGLGDRSFNDSAYSGLLEAQQKFNIRFETGATTEAIITGVTGCETGTCALV